MIREIVYHKYENRAGKDNSLSALFFICNIFHIFIPYKKNTIYYKYTKAHLIYIQKQFVSLK